MGREQLIQAQVTWFLNPVFVDRNVRTGETVMNGLAEDDFRKVMTGYACGNCLAEFDSYTVTCPVCGEKRDTTDDVPETPELWLNALRDRENPPPVSPRADRRVSTEAIYGVAAEADDLHAMT